MGGGRHYVGSRPFLLELFKKREHFIEPIRAQPTQLRHLHALAGGDRIHAWPTSDDPECTASRQFAQLIDAFGAQYGWNPDVTLGLNLDEIYLLQDAIILRNNAMQEAYDAQAKGQTGPTQQLSAEQAFSMFGGEDEE